MVKPPPGLTAPNQLALVIDEHPTSTGLLAQAGYTPVKYHPRQVCSALTQDLGNQIKNRRVGLVWAVIPSAASALPVRYRTPTIRRIASWTRTARSQGIPAVIISPHGRHWRHEALHELAAQGVVHETVHPTRYSNVTHCSFTTFIATADAQLASATKALPAGGPGRSALKEAASAEIFAYLIQHLRVEPGLDHIGHSTMESSFPTEAKEKEKEKKKAGKKPKKRDKPVEDHYDDLGDDLSGLGLGKEAEALFSDFANMWDFADESDDDSEDEQAAGMVHFALVGYSTGLTDPPEQVHIAANMDTAASMLTAAGSGIDICEFCGGEARTTTVAIRRRLVGGRNFDLITQIDLGREPDQAAALRYLDNHHVLALVMAPSCRALGPPSNLNYAINYDTWLRHYQEDKPHVRFCGTAALHQLAKGRHFFVEQPYPTWLVKEDPWPLVINHPGVATKVLDRCMVEDSSAGAVDGDQLFNKKPTLVIASDEALVSPFDNLRCDGRHQHGENWGNTSKLKNLQVWTWPFAQRVVEGIVRLKAKLRKQCASTYPTIGTGPDDITPPTAPKWWDECEGCRGNMARTRREHTRTPGKCRYPNVEPEPIWTCPGCARVPQRARGHDDHTGVEGECRWASASTRNKGRHARSGPHPREARLPAETDPNVDIPGPQLNPELEPLAPPGENNVRAPGAASSSDPAPQPAAPPRAPEDADSHPPRQGRGPDQQPRAVRQDQPRVIEAAVGDNPSDWTSFDVSRSLRKLRTGNPALIERELRKLHLRWWHATRAAMERVLGAAGIPNEILNKIAAIIDTCRECRVWKRPAHDPTQAVELTTRQNEVVECDIMFYKGHMAFHMVDRADRFQTATEVTSKTAESLCEAIDTCWTSMFGPMKVLVVDGEKGIDSEECKASLKRKGIDLRVRAPGQHAQMVERRGAILRHTMHCAEQQLKKEGVKITFKQLLAECVFSGNALTSHDGATPYHARFGTTPAMLPCPYPPSTHPHGLGRDLQRAREVALQKTIESTALSRINRALGTVTTVPGEVIDYQPGEWGEFYRKPGKKDTPGWVGPARVVRNEPARGQVIMRWHSIDVHVKYPDARRYMETASFVYGTSDASLDIVARFVCNMPARRYETFGYVRTGEKWIMSEASRYYRNVALALDYVIRTWLNYSRIVTARLGRGVARFGECAYASTSMILWWFDDIHHHHTFYADSNKAVSTPDLVGERWSAATYLQLLFNKEADRSMQDIIDHEGATSAGAPSATEQAEASAAATASASDRLSVIPEGNESEVESELIMGPYPHSQPGNFVTRTLDGTALSRPGANVSVAESSSGESLSQPGNDVTRTLDGTVLSRPGANVSVTELSSSETLEDLQNQLETYLAACEEEEWQPIEYENDAPNVGGIGGQVTGVPVYPGLHYHAAGADPEGLGQDLDMDEQGNKYVEILCPSDAAKLLVDEPVPEGHCASLRFYLSNCKKAVIDRDTDALTPEEYRTHAHEVRAAVLDELKTWVAHKCFSRRPRKGAWNIVDVRWVGKFKRVKAKHDPTKTVRVIRMRLTLRGFKDKEAKGLVTYAGTASRLAQKITISEACIRGWPLTAIDVRKAFLKGLTYQELAETTGERLREVNFELDKESVHILRMIPGYEDFDPVSEVLHNDKPGTGFKDAPRCFALKLARATQGSFGAKPTTHDDQLLVRHNASSELDFIGTIHVDDVKVACPPQVLSQLVNALIRLFGDDQLEITANNFTNCGMRHTLSNDGSYTMDQIEYISAMKPIVTSKTVGTTNDQPATPEYAVLYLSLLMALAFTALTRPDIIVYIVALQRYAQAPLMIHIRRLNAILRWAQTHPLKLVYPKMQCARILEVHSDSGFRREDADDGHSIGRAAHGVNVIRRSMSGAPEAAGEKGVVCHLLDWLSRTLRQVSRSTFTAETLGVIAAADSAIVICTMLHEVVSGPLAPKEAARLSEEAGLAFEIHLCTDSLNLLLALEAARMKQPAERSFFCHLVWLRQKLARRVIRQLLWLDTRDMTSDGHTKGSVGRTALQALAQGNLVRLYKPRALALPASVVRSASEGEAATSGLTSAASACPEGDGPKDRDYSECESPFEVLGLQNCTYGQIMAMTDGGIKTAFRNASRTHHPDKAAPDQKEHAHEMFLKCTRAKDLLLAGTDVRHELAERFLTQARGTQATEVKELASNTDYVAPGVAFLHGELTSALRQRANSRRNLCKSSEKCTDITVWQDMQAVRPMIGRVLRLPARNRQATPEERAKVRANSQRQLKASSVKNRLKRKLDGIATAKEVATQSDRTYSGPSVGAVKRTSRSWLRAGMHTMQVRAMAAKRRGAALPPNDWEKQAWKAARRADAEWCPPKDPKPKKATAVQSRTSKDKRRRRQKESKRATRAARLPLPAPPVATFATPLKPGPQRRLEPRQEPGPEPATTTRSESSTSTARTRQPPQTQHLGQNAKDNLKSWVRSSRPTTASSQPGWTTSSRSTTASSRPSWTSTSRPTPTTSQTTASSSRPSWTLSSRPTPTSSQPSWTATLRPTTTSSRPRPTSSRPDRGPGPTARPPY